MTDRVHVTMELELYIEDEKALRQAAFERMQAAWTSGRSDADFPFEDACDVPLDQAVASVLADSLPIELPGARRSQLAVETERVDADADSRSDDADDDSSDEDDSDGSDDQDSDHD